MSTEEKKKREADKRATDCFNEIQKLLIKFNCIAEPVMTVTSKGVNAGINIIANER